ncbi:MAG: STAS domain-containing protein [Lachnospiraceae bacterium]|nr:STAS domain-containing protein [Lachnospiraceae bacterium]
MELIDRNLVIHVEDEIDHLAAEFIRREFENVYTKHNIKNVIFDMSDVKFMDSSGIGMIIGRYMKVRYIGGKVAVTGVSDSIDRILKMSGVYRVVSKFDTVDDALRYN